LHCTALKDEFVCVLQSLLPAVTIDADSEKAMITIYDELSRKLCYTRVQSATKQDLAAKKGLASTVETNLCTTLLAQHTKLSTIRKQ